MPTYDVHRTYRVSSDEPLNPLEANEAVRMAEQDLRFASAAPARIVEVTRYVQKPSDHDEERDGKWESNKNYPAVVKIMSLTVVEANQR